MKTLTVATLLLLFTTTASFTQDPMPIAEAKKLDFGTTISKVAGRVTASDQFRNISFIQDETAGIVVFNSAFVQAVEVGDSVVIEDATLIEFGQTTGAPGTGYTELAGTGLRFTVVPVERDEPRARTTTIPLIGESAEGQLVRLRRVKFQESGAFQGEVTYYINDSFGNEMPVRLYGSTEIAINALEIPKDEVDLIGCVSQFRGAYQILPRFASDIGLSVEEDTVSRSRTLDITTWNLEWYGSTDTTQGPRDKQRQRRSIRQVMDSTRADLYALQEVLTQEALDALSDSLEGSYANLFAANVPSTQKMAYIYNTETITPVTHGLAVNGGSQAWAGGRYPFRLTFDATIDGITRRMVVFNIHGKATGDTTAMEDYQRRKADAETFHQYLADFYSDTTAFVIGDYNDVLTKSVVDSTLPSPYKIFLDDAARWWSPTLPLEERGLKSYVGFSGQFLDHVLATTDAAPFHHRTYLESPQAYLSSYSSTVSDHLPVTSRYFASPVTSVQEGPSAPTALVRLAPNPMIDHGMAEITLPVGGHLQVALITPMGQALELVNETTPAQVRVVQLPVHDLGSGRYTLRVMIDRTITTIPVVITH